MSQKTGRLHQENAKLREEIKRLKGALKSVDQDIINELPLLKVKKESSPVSKDRKKEIREEIDSRLNYAPPQQINWKKSKSYIEEPDALNSDMLVASFGHDESSEKIRDTVKNSKISSIEVIASNSSPKTPKNFNEFGRFEQQENLSVEEMPESPEFENLLPRQYVQTVEPKVLKESFSSFYDDSMNRTGNEEDLFCMKNENAVKKVQIAESIEIKPQKTVYRAEKQLNPHPAPTSEKLLISEIEALRQENMKLRLQLTTSHKKASKKPLRPRIKSKSPVRKFKSRSNTPRDLSSRPFKRNASNLSFNMDFDLTPRRSRHCNTCDHLLSKGYSTIYCSRHGSAKLNIKV